MNNDPALSRSVDNTTLENKKPLLIADDEVLYQRLYNIYMRKYISPLVIVGDGVEAMDVQKNQDFPCILSDFNMPAMNGHELIRKSKEKYTKEGKRIPYIMLSTTNTLEECLKLDTDRTFANNVLILNKSTPREQLRAEFLLGYYFGARLQEIVRLQKVPYENMRTLLISKMNFKTLFSSVLEYYSPDKTDSVFALENFQKAYIHLLEIDAAMTAHYFSECNFGTNGYDLNNDPIASISI